MPSRTPRKKNPSKPVIASPPTEVPATVRMVVNSGDLGREIHVVAWDVLKKCYYCKISKISSILCPYNEAVVRGRFYTGGMETPPAPYNRRGFYGSWHWPEDTQPHQCLEAFNQQVEGDRIKMHMHVAEEHEQATSNDE